MSITREALRESVARALCAHNAENPDAWNRLCLPIWSGRLPDAAAALAVIIPACQEAIRDRAPATQDMRSTEICDALDAAAEALAVFLPEKTDG